MDALETEKAQLAAEVAAMTQELAQNSEEIWSYQAEQAMAKNRVQKPVGHPGAIVNKAHLYGKLMETTNPSSTRQTLQILIKYSRSMNDMLKEIQKIVPLRRTHRRIFDPCPDRQRPPCTRS